MKHVMLFFLLLIFCPVTHAAAEKPGTHLPGTKKCQSSGEMKGCGSGPSWCKNGNETTCSPEMQGRCGKRRGDWYGASQPVATAEKAHQFLERFFSGQGYTVTSVTEKKWGYMAEVIDKNGELVDRVMIDKRSGRIRSIN